jgi:hypothetical protein
MRYHDGSLIVLGDLVEVPVPSGTRRARVVMLGDSYEHLDLDTSFLSWVQTEKVLRPSAVVIEWVGENPFAHDDPRYAPAGNYMFTDVDEWVVRAV